MQEVLIASGIGLLWGITNPFLEQGAKALDSDNSPSQGSFLSRGFFNLRVLVPLLLNQAGSLLFYYLLGNSCTFVQHERKRSGLACGPRRQLCELHFYVSLRRGDQEDSCQVLYCLIMHP